MPSRKKTFEEYANEIWHRDIAPEGEYLSAKKRMLHRCLATGCGATWYAKPNNVLGGSGCPVCARRHRVFRPSRILGEKKCEIESEGVEIVGGVRGRGIHTFRCGCGWGWRVGILSYRGCEKCQYTALLEELGYDLLDPYVDKSTPIRHRCRADGYEWFTKPQYINYGRRCHKCKRGGRTPESYPPAIAERGILPLEKYRGSNTYIRHRCLVDGCGFGWRAAPGQILAGKGCPACRTGGFNPSAPGMLYFLELAVTGHSLVYRVGITNRKISKRFTLAEMKSVRLLETVRFESGAECADTEKLILSLCKGYEYLGEIGLKSGKTEVFTVDPRGIYAEYVLCT